MNGATNGKALGQAPLSKEMAEWLGGDARDGSMARAPEPPEPARATALSLGPQYHAKAGALRDRFRHASSSEPIGEQILEELVATETPIAMALQDAEAALVALLHRTVTDPQLAVAVVKLLKETVLVSNAVRRRIENSLGAVANLRAQRDFLDRRGG